MSVRARVSVQNAQLSDVPNGDRWALLPYGTPLELDAPGQTIGGALFYRAQLPDDTAALRDDGETNVTLTAGFYGWIRARAITLEVERHDGWIVLVLLALGALA